MRPTNKYCTFTGARLDNQSNVVEGEVELPMETEQHFLTRKPIIYSSATQLVVHLLQTYYMYHFLLQLGHKKLSQIQSGSGNTPMP